jgi:catechol-2,3-dioxygenase
MTLAESLDHFVVPVDDLVVAEEFYVRVFGGVVTKRNGLNVRQRKRGAVYLQSEERLQPTSVRGLPTYSFTTTASGLHAVAKDLNELGARFDGLVRSAHPFADQILFMTDPAGNHYAIYTPSDSTKNSAGSNGRMPAWARSSWKL